MDELNYVLHTNKNINIFMLKGFSESEATKLAEQCRNVANACSGCGVTMDDAIHLILNTHKKDCNAVKELSETLTAIN